MVMNVCGCDRRGGPKGNEGGGDHVGKEHNYGNGSNPGHRDSLRGEHGRENW